MSRNFVYIDFSDSYIIHNKTNMIIVCLCSKCTGFTRLNMFHY